MKLKYKKIIAIILVIIFSGVIVYDLYHSIPKIFKDISEFDRDNTSEDKVIEANYFSSYKGVFIIKISNSSDAFSYGIIYLGNKVSDYNSIKHEYGHYLQLQELGLMKYTRYVVIPSLIGYWSGVNYNEYYSQPWEYGADLYGGVKRNDYIYDDNVLEKYNSYITSFY